MSEKRNIVLITLDSVRADHCSFMGYHRETTPNIDRMAREGLYFENAIAPSVPTGPSIFGVFTGEYCPIGGVDFSEKKWRKEFKRRKTLAEVLSQKGYNTSAIHPHPYASAIYGFDKGFKYFDNFVQKGQIESMKGSKISSLIVSLRKIILKEGTALPWEKFYGKILEWVESCEKPYFLWVFLLDTHTPYFPPKKKWCDLSYWELAYLFWKINRRDWKSGSRAEIEKIKNAYDDAIHYADEFVGRLWEDLEDDDPIFVIHADHGDGLGEHGFYRHPLLLYEELIHVPLVIYNANVEGRINKPISLLGLAPTILELIGEDNEFSSESFLHGGRDWVISKVFDGSRRRIAVRTKDWKFVRGQKEEDELYYLKEDPYEQKNVINEYPELAKEMRRIAEIHVKQEMEKRRIRERISSIKL
ncbi:MAG: hypothetical protein DRN64_01885 [Thaumarchaeota archaeon]|nr:MAG: hypothetical protein DRN64_01885 [Nitrososphaerota archaeon]